jgi:Lon protease-like protein
MNEIPLFPLHTVLFPGAPLRLHIFEPRYKQMIQACLDKQQPFGVVLIREGVEALGPLAHPYSIGCSARIMQLEPLPEGRMNLSAVGEERFQIRSLSAEIHPYWMAKIEPYPLLYDDSPAIQDLGSRVKKLVQRYLRMTAEAGINQFDPSQLPEDPVKVAYLGASLVHLSLAKKQELLSLDQAADLLKQVVLVYQREIALVRTLLVGTEEQTGSFSRN